MRCVCFFWRRKRGSSATTSTRVSDRRFDETLWTFSSLSRVVSSQPRSRRRIFTGHPREKVSRLRQQVLTAANIIIIKLRANLQCMSFTWKLENVFKLKAWIRVMVKYINVASRFYNQQLLHLNLKYVIIGIINFLQWIRLDKTHSVSYAKLYNCFRVTTNKIVQIVIPRLHEEAHMKQT